MRLTLKITAVLAAPFVVLKWNAIIHQFGLSLGSSEFSMSVLSPVITVATCFAVCFVIVEEN